MKPNYRYGYQGSEKENAINPGGYSTEYRILDVRIGRWFSTDPITQPWQSPYTSMDNNPVALNDVLGLFAEGDKPVPGGDGPPSFPDKAPQPSLIVFTTWDVNLSKRVYKVATQNKNSAEALCGCLL